MIRSNIGLSGLSSVCHVPDNVRANEYGGVEHLVRFVILLLINKKIKR
jgi:hypothetical protein